MSDDGRGDPRPRPQFGEYATPEEQRARIQQPDATWALDVGQAPAEQDAEAPKQLIAEPSPAAVSSGRNIDRIVTLSLLIVGAVNVIFTAISYLDLGSVADQAMKMLGIQEGFTNVEAARVWGPVAAVALVIGYLITVFFAWRRASRGRMAFWVPLVGAVVTYIVVYLCLAVPLLGDPAFVRYATNAG